MLAFYAVLTVVGLVVLVIGSSIVSSETVYDDQVSGINLAIIGVVLANAAGVSLLVTGRRAVSLRRVAVLGALPQLPARGAARPATDDRSELVGTDGLRHFHRADCALAGDRGWSAMSRAAHVDAGRTPCGVCRP